MKKVYLSIKEYNQKTVFLLTAQKIILKYLFKKQIPVILNNIVTSKLARFFDLDKLNVGGSIFMKSSFDELYNEWSW